MLTKNNSYIIIDNIYSTLSNRNSYNYYSNDSSQYFSLSRSDSTFNIIALYPNNGSHITTKRVTPPTASIELIRASGRFQNNRILIHYALNSSANSDCIILVNTDVWTSITYVSSSTRNLLNYSPLFGTNQIMLLLHDQSEGYLTIQTAYDKLHNTEFYSL